MADFEPAAEITLQHEGGFNHDTVTGEVVNFGITLNLIRSLGILKSTGPTLQSDIGFVQSLTLEEAKQIYLDVFWDPCKLDNVDDQNVAAKVFDLHVNTGHGIKFLQEAVSVLEDIGLSIDGIVGPQTLLETNRCDPTTLIGLTSRQAKDGIAYGIRRFAEIYYCDCNQPSKLPGWMNRLES